MKRVLVTAALIGAAVVPATAATANHLCVTSGGQTVYCAPHVDVTIDQICVTSGGSPIICAP